MLFSFFGKLVEKEEVFNLSVSRTDVDAEFIYFFKGGLSIVEVLL
jgi:hypothetical protein